MPAVAAWTGPTAWPSLGSDEVHLWRASLDAPAGETELLDRVLSADERARADRFRFERDRRRYVIARGVLRSLLGGYLQTGPATVRFQYGRYGKPALGDEDGGDALGFNLSHSEDVALYAISRGRALGVDVERVRPNFGGMAIAERFFSPREVAALRSLPHHEQSAAFFRCWTRKEAYIKARGDGLSLRLDCFDVSLAPGEPAALLDMRDDPDDIARWRLWDVSPDPDYAAALVVEGWDWRLCCWRWPAGGVPTHR